MKIQDVFRLLTLAPESISFVMLLRTKADGASAIARVIASDAQERVGLAAPEALGGFCEFVRDNIFVRDLRKTYLSSCLLCLAGALTLAGSPNTRSAAIVASFIWLIVLALTMDANPAPVNTRKFAYGFAKKLKRYVFVGLLFSAGVKTFSILLN
jgi:hypothetical protein